MLVVIAITILTPQLIRRIIDRGIYGDEMQFLSSPVVTLPILVGLKALVMYLQGNWTEITSRHVVFDLRNEIHRKIEALSFSFHNRMQTGQIPSRSFQDSNVSAS